MRRWNYEIETHPDFVRESDLATCGHCQVQLRVEPAKDGHVISRILPPCHGCGKYLCGPCLAEGRCDPWEEKMKRAEARQALLRSLGM